MPLTPIDSLIAPLLSKKPLTDTDRVKLWEALKRFSNSLYNPEKSDLFNSDLFINKLNQVVGLKVEGVKTIDPNFNSLTPQVPLEGYTNVIPQLDEGLSLFSAYVPNREDIGIFGSTLFGISGANQQTALEFNPYNVSSNTAEYPMPVAGWLRNLHTYTSVANGPSTGIILIKLDGVVQFLKVSIPPNFAGGVTSNIRTALRLEKGETFRFQFKVLGSTNIDSGLHSVALEYATDDGSNVIGWSSAETHTIGALVTTYLNPLTSLESTTIAFVETTATFAGTLRNFHVQNTTGQSALGSLVFTIFKNGIATAVTVTISASDPVGIYADYVNSVSVAKGDRITIQVVNNANATSCRFHVACFTILPSIRTSILGGNFDVAIASGGTANSGPFSDGNFTDVRCNLAVTRAGILRNLYVYGGAFSPAVTFTIYVDDVATALTVTKARSSAAAWVSDLDLGHSVSVVRGQVVRLVAEAEVFGTTSAIRGWSCELVGA